MQEVKNKFSINQYLKQWILPLSLVFCIVVVKLFPSFLEEYYSNGIYQNISKVVRKITGWISISLGDIFYGIVLIRVFFLVVMGIRAVIRKEIYKQKLFVAIGSFFRTLLWVFIVFNIAWGLNYNRKGIAHQLKINNEVYTKDEVKALTCELIDKLNATRKLITTKELPNPSFETIFKQSTQLYKLKSSEFPFLQYQSASIKTSLFSNLSHYVGFTGYYNPFSGEAQVTTDMPKVLAPFVTCHEIAHQLGYASEDEANFVGYLTCSNSNDAYFKYSVYIDLYKYAAMELYMMDTAETHGWELDSLVRKDLLDIRNYFSKKRNHIAPVMTQIYSQYLKANQQTRGVESYNDVIGLLIAYQKKYKKL